MSVDMVRLDDSRRIANRADLRRRLREVQDDAVRRIESESHEDAAIDRHRPLRRNDEVQLVLESGDRRRALTGRSCMAPWPTSATTTCTRRPGSNSLVRRARTRPSEDTERDVKL